jgi:chemotaxis protein methyltransferase CheR
MSPAPARPGALAAAVADSEFAFTREDFRRLAGMLYDHAGIALADSKATLVYSRLGKRMRALGLQDFRAYCDLVASADGEAERGRMVNALTTNHTRFFREPHHFDHLREAVLTPIAAEVRAGARLRLWSAGCSSGEEAFSIALTVLSVIPPAAELDVKILATDIDSDMIAWGGAGIYAEEAVEPIPPALRSRWLERVAGEPASWRFTAPVRSLVAFKPLNLMASWPVKGPFRAIFCRNVVIYFDEPTQERVWTRFAPLLEPASRLYIGHSERLGANAGYVSDGLTVYRSRNEPPLQGSAG